MNNLPFDTSIYDGLPISTFIYEPIYDTDGFLADFRIVYGNNVFADIWRGVYGDTDFVGKAMIQNHIMDDNIQEIMTRFLNMKPYAFSTYLPTFDVHLHFQPMAELLPPFYGFFVTDVTDYEEERSKVHFLRNIKQLKNTAVLLRKHDDNRLETVFVSDDFAKMMECTVEDAMKLMNGMGFYATTRPEDRPLVRSIIKNRVSDDGDHYLTVQKVSAKGHSIRCHVHYAFIDDFSEHYIYCTYFNVTVMKEYEERLRSVYVSLGNTFYQENEKTLSLFRANLTRNTIEDIKGIDLFATDYVENSYSELIRLRSNHYPIAAEQESFLDSFDKDRLISCYLHGKTIVEQILYSCRKNGHMCYVKFSASLTRHPMSGDVIAFITEQECNNEKVSDVLQNKILVRQFDMVSYLAEGQYGVVIGDPSRIERGGIFPLARSGSYRQYIEDQVLPVISGAEEDREAADKALRVETIAREVRKHEPYVVNISCDIGGELYNKQFDFYAIDPEANFYILLKSDTTAIQREQRQLNQQLSEALIEAQQANVAKTAFLSRMSHEIRTPMNAIIGLDTIALQEKEMTDTMRGYLDKIGSSAKYLLTLINDILDMSRIESGRMTLKNEEFRFGSFLEQINTVIQSQCREKGLDYKCRTDARLANRYIGDATKLKQVIINILGNAVKFTEAPGKISLDITRTALSEKHSTLRFVVKDTGIGMDAEYLPKIFEAFSQEDSTNTNRYGGSGLGLAISKNIIKMMNGDITVTSKKGEGSAFTIDVMLRNTEQSTAYTNDEINMLLIIDPEISDMAVLPLEEAGIAPDVCSSCDEGIEAIRLRRARQNSYNVIMIGSCVWDIAAADRMRAEASSNAVIVMLTSESDEAKDTDKADGVLSIPLRSADITNELRQISALRHRTEKKSVELKGKRILLAEDVFINAEIMKRLLSMKEMDVEHVENGALAVKLFEEKPEHYFDAVLMDIRMPVMDGLKAAQTIRELERADSKTIPIIAMTANAFDEDVQRSLRAGMNAHLTKPVEPEQLYKTLSDMIGEIYDR